MAAGSCFSSSIEAEKQELIKLNGGSYLKNLVHHDPVDTFGRLKDMGLSIEILQDAVAMGESARASCTENDPAIVPGLLAWARTVRGLRELLKPEGWCGSRAGGLETVVSPDGKLAIAVATGDESTGFCGSTPKTKYPRGPSTEAAIEQNQLPFFEEPEKRVAELTPSDRVTWLLLISSSPDTNDIRCELSLPNSIGDNGKVEQWSERILLPTVRRDPEPTLLPAHDESEIVVEVSRRVV